MVSEILEVFGIFAISCVFIFLMLLPGIIFKGNGNAYRNCKRNLYNCNRQNYNPYNYNHTSNGSNVNPGGYFSNNGYDAVDDMLNYPSQDGPLYNPNSNQLYDNFRGGWDN